MNREAYLKLFISSGVTLLLFLNFASAGEAGRVITLAPNLAELVVAAGGEKQLVGVSAYSDYPERLKKLPVIGDSSGVSLEKIVALKPDLIIAWRGGTSPRDINKLEKLGFKIYQAEFKTILDIPKEVKIISQLTGHIAIGKTFERNFKQHYLFLKPKFALNPKAENRKIPAVFYEISSQPLLTLNKFSLVNEAIEFCGGKNIFKDASGIAPNVSLENILANNPDIIFISHFPNESKTEAQEFWQKYATLSAVKNQKIIFIDSNEMERYGVRLLNGVEKICREISLV